MCKSECRAYSLPARSCLQLKHQVSDLEREAQRAREDRHEELETSKKRMERRVEADFTPFLAVFKTLLGLFGRPLG